jgi:hypothetical protein
MKLFQTTAMIALLVSFSLGASMCAPGGGEIRLAHPIKFDGPGDARVMKLVPRKEQVKLEGAHGELLARFAMDGGRLRVEREPHEAAGFIAPPGEGARGLQVLDGSGGKLMYQLLREPDGDMRLEDDAGKLLYKLKLREYGFKTVDASGAVQSRVRVKPGKVSLRDATGQTTLSTEDEIPPAAAACFTLVDLPLAYQTGLALGIIHWGLVAQ